MELQVMTMYTMHDDENVNRAVAGFSWIRSYFWKSLSEWKSEINGANVKGEAVQDCGASEGEGPFSESLSACGWHTKSEAVRRWAKLTRTCVCMQYFWQIPGTTFRKGAITQRWDLVQNSTWYRKPVKRTENRSDVILSTASNIRHRSKPKLSTDIIMIIKF